ncbi:dihydrolipoamide acetyltransferase family protein [Alkalibacter saccharofermentans]|nr:dihydrolipoamide acetyltransferase family protein [Alkalibacter saccharofermentans]
MAKIIELPKLGMTMDEGAIVKLYIKEGDEINKGDILFDVETDKVTQGVESEESGFVLKIYIEEGETVPVGEKLLAVGEEGEALETEQEADEEKKEEDKKEEKIEPEVVKPHTSDASKSDRVSIAPRAKKLASDKNIDYSQIKGSGKDGMITVEDIEKSLDSNKPIQGSKLEGQRAIIAKRLTQSNVDRPHIYLTRNVNMTKCIEMKSKLEVKATITDFIVWGIAKALKEFPMVNASLVDDVININESVNVGLAVEGKNGLVVPVIKEADKKDISEISKERMRIVNEAKEGALKLGDLEGGTFTISNLGMLNVDQFTSIINPPESGILSVGKANKKLVVDKDESIKIQDIAVITLAVDHRIIDGAYAARFFDMFSKSIEEKLDELVK